MAEVRCPYCDEGNLKTVIVRDYHTQLGGIPFVVNDATILQCDTCGKKVFDANEVRRWEQELRKELQNRGALVRPEDVRAIRESLGLGVSQLTALLGVTRQTVYAWERREGGGLQLSPAALLLGLLRETLAGREKGVLEHLIDSAKQRGQPIPELSTEGPTGGSVAGEEGRAVRAAVREIPRGAPSFGRSTEAA